MTQHRKEVVLFDHDGVLVDTEPWYFRAGERAYDDVGLRLDRDAYIAGMASGVTTWAHAVAAGADEAVVEQMRRARNAYYQEYLRTEQTAISGVVDVLAALSGHVRMAIVTTSKRADFELIHADGVIPGFMEFVLMRDDYSHPKPHPEPYLMALARLGATPEQALVVEDSERGLRAAVAAGVECAVVHNAFTASQDFAEATYRIDALAGVLPIVRGEGSPETLVR